MFGYIRTFCNKNTQHICNFTRKVYTKTSKNIFFGYIETKISIYTQEDINGWVLLDENLLIYPKCKMMVQDISFTKVFRRKAQIAHVKIYKYITV